MYVGAVVPAPETDFAAEAHLQANTKKTIVL